MSQLSITCVIKQILQPERDTTGAKPFVRNLYYIETIEQYPEKAIIEVFDKDGDGSVWQKILSDLGHFPRVVDPVTGEGEMFECYFHLDAAVGVSNRTGKPYTIMKPLSVWRFGPPVLKESSNPRRNDHVEYEIPQYNGMQAPAQEQAPAPQFNVPQGPAQQPMAAPLPNQQYGGYGQPQYPQNNGNPPY